MFRMPYVNQRFLLIQKYTIHRSECYQSRSDQNPESPSTAEHPANRKLGKSAGLTWFLLHWLDSYASKPYYIEFVFLNRSVLCTVVVIYTVSYLNT